MLLLLENETGMLRSDWRGSILEKGGRDIEMFGKKNLIERKEKSCEVGMGDYGFGRLSEKGVESRKSGKSEKSEKNEKSEEGERAEREKVV
mmetsp:Transcript_16965/g.23521  ORF Transcript_16965/g.23521 Transcript_16965/m.23521 type:complete len:91 (+) Transcript_16965:970-1242(+)